MNILDQIEQARKIFTAQGGTLRTSEAIALHINPSILYAMRDSGELEKLSRGLYRIDPLPQPPNNPDQEIVNVVKRTGGIYCEINWGPVYRLQNIMIGIVVTGPKGYDKIIQTAPPPRYSRVLTTKLYISGLKVGKYKVSVGYYTGRHAHVNVVASRSSSCRLTTP